MMKLKYFASLVILFGIFYLPSCSTYKCKAADGVTCMKVEDVLHTSPGATTRNSDKAKPIIIGLKKDVTLSEESLPIEVITNKPVNVTIFKYKDKNGVIHDKNIHILPPKPPKIEINEEK